MTKKDIISEISKYVVKSDNNFKNWCVGITNNPERRLFNADEHNVDKNNGEWIHCPADSKADAQNIEEYFLSLGIDGDTGGGKDDTTFVYCYKKTPETNP